MKYRFLVTCSTGEIGSALCLHLAKKGHHLILTGRNTDRLKKLSTDIKKQYPDSMVNYYSADLGNPESMNEIISQSKTLGIDGVVLMPPRPPILPDEPLEQFRTLNQALQDCFTGPRYLLQELLPSMQSSQLKSVVLVSGASSKQPIIEPTLEAFNDVRTAWVGCLKSLSDNYGKKGVRFNTISPGHVLTPRYQQKLKDEAQTTTQPYLEIVKQRAASASLQKIATLNGVVKAIYFFLKSSGSNEITANNLHIDGGKVRSYY